MSKWIVFDDKIIKKKDCDFFEMCISENKIRLHFHQGISYLDATEQSISGKHTLDRFNELKQLLGIK